MQGNEQYSGMIRKETLNQAKAFLCWDTFPGLTIQLIEMQEAVSFFYPPSKKHTIIQYYERGKDDFSIPLFQLFHEAGHFLQFTKLQQEGGETDFWKAVDQPAGRERYAFEKESWILGRNLFSEFLNRVDLSASLLNEYDLYAGRSVESYR
jgi:hypothetical protein